MTDYSTVNPIQSFSSIVIENPVDQNLIYTAKDKVAKIEIHSAEEKILKTIKSSYSSGADLPEGIYTAKVIFENGTVTSKKLMKN